jgi:hypothetical protein
LSTYYVPGTVHTWSQCLGKYLLSTSCVPDGKHLYACTFHILQPCSRVERGRVLQALYSLLSALFLSIL